MRASGNKSYSFVCERLNPRQNSFRLQKWFWLRFNKVIMHFSPLKGLKQNKGGSEIYKTNGALRLWWDESSRCLSYTHLQTQTSELRGFFAFWDFTLFSKHFLCPRKQLSKALHSDYVHICYYADLVMNRKQLVHDSFNVTKRKQRFVCLR